jgi:beta-glucosidase/6-phospho-beta-glucosidase/beta-galactosidase/lysophospholipase L1-like esterase
MVTVATIRAVVDDSPASRVRSLERLEYHRSVLERSGIPALSDLGTLDLSGSVVATPGIVQAPPTAPGGMPPPVVRLPGLPFAPFRLPAQPSPAAGAIPGFLPALAPVSVLRSRDDRGNVTLEPGFVIGGLPPGALFSDWSHLTSTATAVSGPSVAALAVLDIAYFVGQTVNLADDTVVVLKRPHQYLTFIAEHLHVGANVTFTYEHPVAESSPVSWPLGNRGEKPPKAPTPNGHWGVTGAIGVDGAMGGNGFQGVDAPEIELWALTMSGAPIFDLRGQDGWAAGRGRDGGEGGDGSDGIAETYDFFGWCASGAGWGGDGGPGGNGGNGGSGGAGGHGGRLRFYAPRDVLVSYAAGGFRITTDGGSGGQPGGPGAPGPGGRGGLLGPRPKNCAMSEQRHDGAPGPQGSQGSTGTQGPTGDNHTDAVAFLPITEHDFAEELTKPALLAATPPRAEAGTTVTVSTLRVQSDDTLLLDDTPIPMSVVADTLVTFVLPAVPGGQRVLRIRQADGTASNRLSFYVLPRLQAVGDGMRARPGTTVSVNGSGFAEGARVRVTGEDMNDAVFVNGATMTFTLRRPVNTVDNASGEVGHCQVILGDGTASNVIDFTIDTLLIVALGDSVAWGQGLRSHEKFTTQVADAFAASQGGIKSYISNLAHSGATIGVGDATTMDPIDGEVPTSYPTALQQLPMFSGDPAAVDLVIVTAGLNDTNIRTILNPLNNPLQFAESISQHCHRDLRTLLSETATMFPTATIIATGYYAMVSEDSEISLVEALLVAAGVAVGGLPGGVLAAGLIPQIVTNCRAFYELSTLAIRSAVDDVNDRLLSPRAVFVDAGFKPENAALASQAWLYGINADLSPQDKFTSGDRAAACALNSSRTSAFQCARASIGHPNATGATAYANAIIAALKVGPADAESSLPPFPPGFLFGVATAAMQNEGGITNNDWYAFTTSPAIKARVANITDKGGGPIAQLSPPGDADKHADLDVLKSDLDRAAGLGVNSYRFSIEWARLMPARASHGGPLDDADMDMDAVAYYDHVLDALEARSMTPVLTLNHLTLPLWVLDPPRDGTFSLASFGGIEVASADDPSFKNSMGGWENSETIDEYVRLVTYLVTRWKDRVNWWVTLNEPVGSMIGVGYFAGIWPPGFTGDGARGKTAYFNLIRAHIRAYEAIKAVDATSMVGFAHAMIFAKVTYEHSDHLFGDQDAARNQFDYFYNWHMLDTVIDGHLDTEINRRLVNRQYLEGAEFAKNVGIDPNTPWGSHCDFVGLNYYRSVYVFNDQLVSFVAGYSGGRFLNDLQNTGQVHQLLNPLGWEINPGGFGSLMRELHDRYGVPILVTENGIPQAEDISRSAFIAAHLTELLSAASSGVDVRGYMYWTLADNWEWQEGYRPESHFGLFTVDRSQPTQPRHLNSGAEAYAFAIATSGVRGIRDAFGAITVGGDEVRPPRRSPAFLSGTIDGQPFEMTLRSSPDGRICGLMWEKNADRYLRVVGQFDRTSATVALTHPAGSGASAGSLFGGKTAGAGLSLAGTLTRDGVEVPWSASQDVLVGQWVGQGALPRVQITRTPGGVGHLVGSWLGDDLPRGWQPVTVTVNAGDVVLDFGGDRAVASLTGHDLIGTLTVQAQSNPWTATRLPDPLGLI